MTFTPSSDVGALLLTNSECLLTIWRDGKSVAGVRVNVTTEERKAVHNSLSTTETPKGRALIAITFAGDNRRLTFEEPAAAATDE